MTPSMDIKWEIEQEHSKAMAHKIAAYVGRNRNRFNSLLQIYLNGTYRTTQRAAYPMGICVERYPDLITPHLSEILNFLKKGGIHDAVKRNTMRMLQHVEIPKRYQGKVLSYCFNYLQSKSEPVAVKVFSMTVLSNLIKEQPDLEKELRIILEDQLPYASPAFLSRARKLLKRMKSS